MNDEDIELIFYPIQSVQLTSNYLQICINMWSDDLT